MTTYEWKWKRSPKKFFLELLKDGKKIGSARDMYWTPQCTCGPDYNCYGPTADELPYERVVAYVGGKKIGMFPTMVAAKIAIEQELGVSTKKTKKKPEPKRITTAPHQKAKEIVQKKFWGIWCKKDAARAERKRIKELTKWDVK